MSAATYPKHESYKDSDIDWIGEVPASWSVEPGRQCLYESKEKNIGMKESTVLSLSYGKVIVKDEDKLTGLVPESFETYQVIRPGDIIIRGTDLQNDMTSLRTGLARDNGIITSAYINLRPRAEIHPEFLHYLLHSYDVKKVFYALGSGLRQNLSYEDFKYLRLPVPSLPEQRAIASFLDGKCAKIDEAVRIKEEQIKLLRERRQILIQQAVTRGLNPDAPMKDSGIDWIGQIPAHWRARKISHIGAVGNGSTPSRSNSAYWQGGDIPWLNSSKVNDFVINRAEQFVTVKAKRECHLPSVEPGDLVMGITGQGRTRGMVAISKISTTINQHLAYIRVKSDEVYNEYLLYFFVASYEWLRHQSDSSGSTKGAITCEDIKNYVVLIPPLPEQEAIFAHIRDGGGAIDAAISIKEDQIAALKEYKSSLINAAVTGKIKVC
jgi:type I restriction enzyme S subunit